jgi:hypothetical protein
MMVELPQSSSHLRNLDGLPLWAWWAEPDSQDCSLLPPKIRPWRDLSDNSSLAEYLDEDFIIAFHSSVPVCSLQQPNS